MNILSYHMVTGHINVSFRLLLIVTVAQTLLLF